MLLDLKEGPLRKVGQYLTLKTSSCSRRLVFK